MQECELARILAKSRNLLFTESLRSDVRILLFEQILKRLSRIGRPRTGGRRCFLLACHPHFIGWTVVARVFFRHSLFHRLHALKPAARVEVHALLARVQLKSALRALPFHAKSLQNRAALRAARNLARSGQVHRPRPQSVVPFRRTALALRRSFPRRLFLRFVLTIPISRLPVFRHRLLPGTGHCLAALPARASLSHFQIGEPQRSWRTRRKRHNWTFVLLCAPLWY